MLERTQPLVSTTSALILLQVASAWNLAPRAPLDSVRADRLPSLLRRSAPPAAFAAGLRAASLAPRPDAALRLGLRQSTPWTAANGRAGRMGPARVAMSAAVESGTQKAQARRGRGVLKCRPIGIGSASPERIITNKDLERIVETSEEWITTRTGIERRHVLDGREILRDLAIRAAKNALAQSGLRGEDIDLVIVATSSPDDMFGDAPAVAAAIGAGRAFAYDLTAACSGFLFGSVTAAQFVHSGAATNALVVGADALSRWVDWTDRNTCVLFGDGAGAMVLTATETEAEGGFLGFEMHSDGNGYCHLRLPYTPETRALGPSAADGGEGHQATQGTYKPITMAGKEVYKFATREVPRVLEEALANAGLDVSQVDWLLLHQANIRIMEVVADRLGMPMDKVLHNLEEYGNTSAASIPLCLAEAVASGKVKKGDVIACAGFGAGLSWGATIMRWG